MRDHFVKSNRSVPSEPHKVSLSHAARPGWRFLVFSSLMMALTSMAGCNKTRGTTPLSENTTSLPIPCSIALAPTAQPDQRISELQQKVRTTSGATGLADLGWAFIDKARVSYDPGYYRLAENCAACMEARSPGDSAALLIRGHALDSLHRFREAEVIARELVSKRGIHVDYELLGDALMEQGKTSEAIEAYQSMMDQRPGPQAYARAANMRWLTGDLTGAIEMMSLAAHTAGTGEAAAWAQSRLAIYLFQAGDLKKALEACREALELQPDYAPALLARGRILLSIGGTAEALVDLRAAARLNPLPEFQWALAEALSAANLDQETAATERAIVESGIESDPRTVALFLATRGVMPVRALMLAQKELDNRQDVYTRDALAWAQCAAGRFREAQQTIREVLNAGTNEARFFFHAALIAARCGDKGGARAYGRRAASLKRMLLPTERNMLAQQLAGF